jgi:hypothetical protein
MGAELRIRVESPAWESEFITPEYFLEGLRVDDIGDIDSIKIESYVSGRKIAITVGRQSGRRGAESAPLASGSQKPPAATLHVAGPDRDWVRDATEQMSSAIAKESGSEAWGPFAFLLGGAIAVAAAIGQGDVHSGWHVLARVALFGGAVVGASGLLAMTFIPSFQFRPDGQEALRTKAARLARGESVWLLRVVVAAAIGSGLTILFQHI